MFLFSEWHLLLAAARALTARMACLLDEAGGIGYQLLAMIPGFRAQRNRLALALGTPSRQSSQPEREGWRFRCTVVTSLRRGAVSTPCPPRWSAQCAVWAWWETAVEAVLWLAVRAVHPRGRGAFGRTAALRSDAAAERRRRAARPGPVAFGRLRWPWRNWRRAEPARPEAGAHAARPPARRWPGDALAVGRERAVDLIRLARLGVPDGGAVLPVAEVGGGGPPDSEARGWRGPRHAAGRVRVVTARTDVGSGERQLAPDLLDLGPVLIAVVPVPGEVGARHGRTGRRRWGRRRRRGPVAARERPRRRSPIAGAPAADVRVRACAPAPGAVGGAGVDTAVPLELGPDEREIPPHAEHTAAPPAVVGLAGAALEDAVGAAERARLHLQTVLGRTIGTRAPISTRQFFGGFFG